MKTEFDDLGFVVIRNFISEKKAIKLSDEFREFCDKNKDITDPDQRVPNAPAIHNYSAFVELLSSKTSKVSKFVGERVLPSYCYTRVYTNKSLLESHVDRPSCEVSLTVHLDSDKQWEFCIEDKTGKENKIILNRGDAVLYSGQDLPHWREEYEGSFYSQVFLHYVKSSGDHKFNYFEKISYGTHSHELSKFIKVHKNAIPENLCDKIIEEYFNDADWEDALVMSGRDTSSLNTDWRNCKYINITSSGNNKKRKKIDDKVFEYVGKIITDLHYFHPHLNIETDSGYTLLRYGEGQYYKEHIDAHATIMRKVSCSIILNDEYEGGEFGFFGGSEKYKLKKGSAITFPSNFLFPHQIFPVTKGVRYAIITWFT